MNFPANLLAQNLIQNLDGPSQEFWIAITLGSLGIVLGLRTVVWIIRASLEFCERKQVMDVMQTLAQKGQLDPERVAEMIASLTAKKGRGMKFTSKPQGIANDAHIAATSRERAIEAQIETRDGMFRIGFLLLTTSLGFFAAAAIGGVRELLIPACIAGGVGLGLSGMGVARREAIQRIRDDVERADSRS
jgi:hypothetical protein